MLFTGFIPLYVILNVLNYRQHRAQLQKEKGKNKMLMQRLKEGDNTNTSQDIIWAQGPPNSHGQSNISHFRFYWKCNFPINLHDCWLVGRSGCHSFSTHAETQLSENLHKELFTQRKRLNKIGILLISSHYLHNAIKMIFSNDFHKINVPKDWFKQVPIVFPA